MDRLTSTRVFLEVAERGSLTQAAERLQMSSAMVSRHLAAAEQWLGARLLHRTTRRVSLTDAGQAALPTCRQLLELADELQQRGGERSGTPQGHLRVASAASFAEAQLAQALMQFQRLHPLVSLELLVIDRAVDLVEERIDLAVRITNALQPHWVARRLATCRSVLCASPGYLAEHGRPTTPEQLRQHTCVGHSFGAGNTYRFTRAGRSLAVDVAGPLGSNETAIVRRAVLAGAGVAMLPTYFVVEQLRSGELVRLLPGYEPETMGIHALYLSRRHQPLPLRLLIDFLAAQFGTATAPWDGPARRR